MTLPALIQALEGAAVELAEGTIFDQAWSRHLLVDAAGLRMLSQSDRWRGAGEEMAITGRTDDN